MRKRVAIVVSLLAALMLLPLFSPPVRAEATAPTWNAGNSWAMGKKVDLEKNLTDNIDKLKNDMQKGLGWTIDDITAKGTAEAWVVFNVDPSTTADYYKVKSELGAKLAASVHVKATIPLPAAGQYSSSIDPMTDPSVPKVNKTVEVTLIADYALIIDGMNTLNKTNLALKQMDYTAKTCTYISLVGTNIPSFEKSGAIQYVNYTNYDVLIKGDVKLRLLATFEPELTVFQFPMNLHDSWTMDSVANISGSVSGFFTASGLPKEAEQTIFDSDIANMTGSNAFPIDFSKLTTEDKRIDNGTIQAFSVPIQAEMRCTDVIGTAPNEIYEITATMSGTDARFYYKAGNGFLSSVNPTSIPGLSSQVSSMMPNMTMESTDVDTATSAINSIESYQQAISDKANGVTNDSGMMFLIIAIIVIVAAVVCIAVFLVKKK